MRRDGLYRTFNGKKDPQLGRILSLFDGLDLRIVVEVLPTREKPPRPKLGRPRSKSAD
jgi:DNA-binding phage protein